jgi:hypothetical protein
VPNFKGLAGTSSRDSKASEKGCYFTRFTCICFPCCEFFFENFYIHLSPNWFSPGGFIQGHIDKIYMCPISCMLICVDQHFRVVKLRGVLFVLSIIACANHWYQNT